MKSPLQIVKREIKEALQNKEAYTLETFRKEKTPAKLEGDVSWRWLYE